YDLIGRYLSDRDGAPADASGVLTGTDIDGPFTSIVDLSERFARSADVATCLAQRMATQTLGRRLEPGESCAVSRLAAPWTQGGKRLAELVPLMATSD